MPTPRKNLRMSLFSQAAAAPPCVFVLFGSTGDLAVRKILPALYNLARDGLLGEKVTLLCVGRRGWDDDTLREHVRSAIEEHSRSDLQEDVWKRLAERLLYFDLHVDEQKDYASLAERLEELDEQRGAAGNRVLYLATPPSLFEETVRGLGEAGLANPGDGSFVRLVVEKPFGSDLDTARGLNRIVHRYFDERQVYRIDHYLGKETVQNLLVLRFANAIFEPLLNRRYVDNVQITTAENVGMEGRRGPFYERAGALRDMVQNHMLQLTALIAMDPPVDMGARAIRDEKVRVLRAIPPLTPQEVFERTVRGQYAAGDDKPGYRQEEGVAEDSRVETYAAVKLFVDNWRWAGVPFYLRTGKRLATKTSQIVVEFKPEPKNLFEEFTECAVRAANHLHVRIQPDEGIALRFDAKVPGPQMLMRPVEMDFAYGASFGSATPEAYERLVFDAVCGEPTLFIRSDEVEASWRVVDSIRKTWDNTGRPELIEYPPGSWGPEEARALLGDPYKDWHHL